MAKLRIMRKTVKARYAADGRDRCEACDKSIQVGDEYMPSSQRRDGSIRFLYCKACAEERYKSGYYSEGTCKSIPKGNQNQFGI